MDDIEITELPIEERFEPVILYSHSRDQFSFCLTGAHLWQKSPEIGSNK